MTSKEYRKLLIESTVSGIGKMEVFKSPADKIIDSVTTGDAADVAADSSRNCEDAIAVLGRIYDAQDNDRPMIHENDEEHEAQGDSEITVDMPDSTEPHAIQNVADVIDDDKGVLPNPDQKDEYHNSLANEDNDIGLDESFILEGDDDFDGSELPEDEAEGDEDTCPECGNDPCTCDGDEEEVDELDEGDEGLPEDEADDGIEPVVDDNEAELDDGSELPEDDPVSDDEGDGELDEGCQCEDDDTLPEDEAEGDDTCPECGNDPCTCDGESDDGSDLPEDSLDEDDEQDLPDDAGEIATESVVTEDVDDSVLPADEQTGEDTLLSDGTGDEIPAEEIAKDGEVYEGAEDPAIDPNAAPAEDPNAVPAEGGEAPVEGDPNAAAPEGEAPAEDPTQDPNEEQDPVLDIDSQVVATDTTNESVMESLIREMKASDEAYMNYESDDFDSED